LKGGDRADDADRVAQGERELALAGLGRVHRNDVARELPCLDRCEGERRHRTSRLDAGRLHWLARFGADLFGDLVVPLPKQTGDPDENLRAPVSGQRLLHRALGSVDRAPRLVSPRLWNTADALAGVGRPDLHPFAGLDPLAADQELPFGGGHGHS
jgi:hypothetical protein